MLKTCQKCKSSLKLASFAKKRTTRDGLQPCCNSCRQKERREYQQKYKEAISERRKLKKYKRLEKYWPDKTRKEALFEYRRLFDLQCGMCLICKRHRDEFGQDFAVDHCHETGKVRGLLCLHCNVGLGAFRDDPELLANAIEYLKW